MFRKSVFILLTIFNGIIYVVIGSDVKCASGLSQNISDSTQGSIIITLIRNAKNLLDDAQKYAISKTSCSRNEPQCEKPMDCVDIQEKDPHTKSGVHRIWPRSRITKGPIEVYCDMEDDGGAWTVIQRRGDFNSGKDYFYKDWNTYKTGFGNPQKDHWLGNDNIFALTNQRSNIVKFALSDWEGNNTYATYDDFWIEDESRKYTMHASGYRGTAGDSFGTNGMPFTTKDQDNDTHPQNCAVLFKGAWWYGGCHTSNLNGMYLKGAHESHADGVEWKGFRGHYYSLKDTVIKIRPKDFKKNSDDMTPR